MTTLHALLELQVAETGRRPSPLARALRELVEPREGETTYKSLIKALQHAEKSLLTSIAVIRGDDHWEVRAADLATVLVDDLYTIEMLRTQWHLDTVSGRLELAFALLPSGGGLSRASDDFVDRLKTVARKSIEAALASSPEQMLPKVPRLYTELERMDGIKRTLPAFVVCMRTLNWAYEEIDRLMVDNAMNSITHLVDNAMVAVVPRDGTVSSKLDDMTTIPLSKLSTYLERLEKEQEEAAAAVTESADVASADTDTDDTVAVDATAGKAPAEKLEPTA